MTNKQASARVLFEAKMRDAVRQVSGSDSRNHRFTVTLSDGKEMTVFGWTYEDVYDHMRYMGIQYGTYKVTGYWGPEGVGGL